VTGENDNQTESRTLVLRLLVLTIAMFGFGFLMVPIYNAFCEVTGLGGKTNKSPAVVAALVNDDLVLNRKIRLEFDTTVNQNAPWEFSSAVDSMSINPGAIYQATFTARNLTDRHMIAQAIPSIAPAQAARYFKKLECFCFTTQEFDANENREMLVRFVVDSDLPGYIDTISLSYTFFDTAREAYNADNGTPVSH
jgi:cytochrome c oxidase assembly protein subunit 11